MENTQKDIEPRINEMKMSLQKLDSQIESLCLEAIQDQLKIQRLKKQKKELETEIRLLSNSSIPDIIA